VLIGLFGGVVAVIVRIGYDRGVEFRNRQADAADAYLKLVIENTRVISDVWQRVSVKPVDDDGLASLWKRLDAFRSDRLLALARLQLLFGDASRTYRAAFDLDTHLEETSGGLYKIYGYSTLGAVEVDRELFTGPYRQAALGVPAFADAARLDLRQTTFHRWFSEASRLKLRSSHASASEPSA
jgi:hypothetical protein